MEYKNTFESKRFRVIFFYIFINMLLGLSLYFLWPVSPIYHRIYITFFFLFSFFINFFYMYRFSLPRSQNTFSLKAFKNLSSLNLPENEWEEFENLKQKLEKNIEEKSNQLIIEKEKFNQLLNSIPIPVFILNHEQKITMANKSFSLFFELSETFYDNPPSLLSILRVHELEELSLKVQQSNETASLDFSHSRKNDHNFAYFDSYLSPFLYSSQDQALHTMCLLFETTERRLTDKMREEFVANVSHEIRTPLTILMGHIQSLQIGLDKNDQFKDLSLKITQNSNRLLSMINELLELSKIESQSRIQKENLEIDTLIESILFDLKEKYTHLNLEIYTCFDDRIVSVNPKLFDQLMLNMLENAFKYNKANGTIHVHTFSEDSFFKIIIKDTGIGIPKDQVHRIFERFFRVDASRSSQIQGTGLGLSIAKHIVQKHQGSIKVQSNINEGTSFEISLPI